MGSKEELSNALVSCCQKVVDGPEAILKDSLATSAPKTFFVLNFRNRVTIVTCPHLVVSLSDCYEFPTPLGADEKAWEATVAAV